MGMSKPEQRNTPQEEQSLSELLQIRRDKLSQMQAAGQDPFTITTFSVTAKAQEVRDHFEELEGLSLIHILRRSYV